MLVGRRSVAFSAFLFHFLQTFLQVPRDLLSIKSPLPTDSSSAKLSQPLRTGRRLGLPAL